MSISMFGKRPDAMQLEEIRKVAFERIKKVPKTELSWSNAVVCMLLSDIAALEQVIDANKMKLPEVSDADTRDIMKRARDTILRQRSDLDRALVRLTAIDDILMLVKTKPAQGLNQGMEIDVAWEIEKALEK